MLYMGLLVPYLLRWLSDLTNLARLVHTGLGKRLKIMAGKYAHLNNTVILTFLTIRYSIFIFESNSLQCRYF